MRKKRTVVIATAIAVPVLAALLFPLPIREIDRSRAVEKAIVALIENQRVFIDWRYVPFFDCQIIDKTKVLWFSNAAGVSDEALVHLQMRHDSHRDMNIFDFYEQGNVIIEVTFWDHFGNMDFKVTGTQRGVTAVQLDLKARGISDETIAQALELAKDARLQILKDMLAVLGAPREETSEYAPRLLTININPEKIGKESRKSAMTNKGVAITPTSLEAPWRKLYGLL